MRYSCLTKRNTVFLDLLLLIFENQTIISFSESDVRKLKTLMPSLKSQVPNELRSRVVYHISCPGCQSSYVGCTIRHMYARLSEHGSTNQPVGKHFHQCIGSKPELEDVRILQQTPRTVDYLLALESLYIKDMKPNLNTKDEYRSRRLTLNF